MATATREEAAEGAARLAAGSPRLDRGLLSGHVGPRVRLLRNLLMSRVTAALAPFGLSHGALSAMALIAANAHCSQMEISRDLGMEKSAVATIVEELVRRRLAVRSRSRADRRRNLLSLTAKGERTMQAMHAAATEEEGPMEQALTAAEFGQFLSFLDRAYEALAAAGPQAAGSPPAGPREAVSEAGGQEPPRAVGPPRYPPE